MKDKLKKLEERARSIVPIDSGHDFSHIERVARHCIELYQNEIYQQERREITEEELSACKLASFLHDCVPIAKDSPLRKESSRLASEKAREWLEEISWESKTQIDLICDAIHDHSFSSGRIPRSMLGKCLQDADRLEALGAIGLYRTIATGVAMGASLFHAEDPWAIDRKLDDRKYTIDHFFAKLLKLPETFCTQSAKKEAIKRANYLQGFIDQLKSEIELN